METYNVQSCLKCPICHEVYEEPKQLSCGHSFCRSCLEEIRQLYSVSCAICRKPTHFNMAGVAGIRALPTNYPLIQIVEAIKTASTVTTTTTTATEAVHQRMSTPDLVNLPPPVVTTTGDEKCLLTCGDCQAPVGAPNAWVCGDCVDSVFCAPCIITKHKFHRKCVQMHAISTEWQTVCQQFDALTKKIESNIVSCRQAVNGFASLKALFHNTDADMEELDQTAKEMSKMFTEAQRLRWTSESDDFKKLHHLRNLLKQLDFYTARMHLTLPVLNEHIKETNECLHTIENDSKQLKWSALSQKCHTNFHGSTTVLFHWTEPSAKSVSLAGSFTNWKPTIQLVPRNGEFLATVDLPPGRHEFKFWVDDQWRVGSDWQTCKDGEDNLNNLLIL